MPSHNSAGTFRFPVRAYIIIAFGFSWTCWLIVYLAEVASPMREVLITLGVLGPAIGAYIVGNKKPGNMRPAWIWWLVISFLLSAAYYARSSRSAITANGYPLRLLFADPAAVALVILNILAAAALFVYVLRSRYVLPRLGWVMASLALFPLLLVLVGLFSRLLGWSVHSNYHDMPAITLLTSVLVAFPVILLMTAGIEEPGWRGVMQHRLQGHFNPLNAAMLTGLTWGAWHIPLHLLGFYAGGMSAAALFGRIVVSVALSVIIAWFYNKSGRSVLIAMVLHTMSNLSVLVFPQNGMLWLILLILTAITLALAGKMWRRLPVIY